MKLDDKHIELKADRYDISQIGAEMLLNYLYPEMEGEWIVEDKGSFYRNYNMDILALYAEEKRVELSRDGFLQLLPQGLITNEDDLRKAKDIPAKTKELEQRQHLLEEAFLPLDVLHFHRFLKMERIVSGVLNQKMEYLLKQYFGFDLAAEQNQYVREIAVLLPFAKELRGDFPRLRNVMEEIFKCEVNMTEGRYSESDSTVRWIPRVRYDLLIPGLDAEAYRTLSAEVQPFADFLREWFVPAEVLCQVNIKEYGQPQQTDTRLTLDYNTELAP